MKTKWAALVEIINLPNLAFEILFRAIQSVLYRIVFELRVETWFTVRVMADPFSGVLGFLRY